MARNKFEVESLKLKHFYGIAQRENDSEVLKELGQYINRYVRKYGSLIINSSYCFEKNEKVYMFQFQNPLAVTEVIEMLKVMFQNDEWTICQTYHNLSTGLFTVRTL